MPESMVEAAAGVRGLGAALAELGSRSGAQAAIATLGPMGALAWASDREIRVPATDVRVVDTTGAGDAFRAGLAASWLSAVGDRADLEQMLEGATLVAGLACRAAGAQTALPTALEVLAHLRGGV
jgi:sugar/nucleoside kinase (ribokinase family)